MRTCAAWFSRILGVLFILASVDKILHPEFFAQVIVNYQVIPVAFVNPIAIVLPWLELVCGIALMFRAFRRGAALIVVLMLLTFIGLMWFNVARGLDVSCGCFSVRPDAKGDMIHSVWRDTVLLLMAVVVLWRGFVEQAEAKALALLMEDIRTGRTRPQTADSEVFTVGNWGTDEPQPESAGVSAARARWGALGNVPEHSDSTEERRPESLLHDVPDENQDTEKPKEEPEPVAEPIAIPLDPEVEPELEPEVETEAEEESVQTGKEESSKLDSEEKK